MSIFILAQQNTSITAALFYLFAGIATLSALAVAVSRNIVRTAVYLLFTLGSVAGLYFLLASEFLAAVQLVVYAGGTLILIVFGVMLTSRSPFSRYQPSRVEVYVAMAIGAILLFALIIGVQTGASSGAFGTSPPPTEQSYPVDRLGQALLGDYLVPFEIVSVLLLVMMIGAAYLAKARRRDASAQDATRARR